MPKSITPPGRTRVPATQQAHGTQPDSKSVLIIFPGHLQIDSSLIMYCKAEGRYTRFYIDDKPRPIVVCRNIGQYEALLSKLSFCRIHHNCIVNMNFVTGYVDGRTGHVILRNGRELNVSSRRKKDLLLILRDK